MHRLYNFHSAAATDNGNVYVINNCRDSNRTQNFSYDNLNRITQAYTNGNSPLTTSWGETLTIDAWGNLTNKGPVSGKTNTENLNANPASTKNQLNGFCNDAAGNLVLNSTCPTGSFTPTYSYDIENRLTSTNGWTYVYDGDGKRVRKCNSCGTSAGGTLYWPSSVSDTVLETDLAGTRKYEYMFYNGQRIARRDGSNPPYYYFSDHLKSTSVVTNNSGTVQDESDYFPYGGEMVLSNLAPQNYKFSGKERDSESGLDYFGARHHSSNLGRFSQPDQKLFTSRHLAEPQKWNKYAYVQNNPLLRVDPDGLEDWIVFRVANTDGRNLLAGLHDAQWKAAEQAITSQKDAKGNLNTFRMFEGDKATVSEYQKAINNPDAHVVFVGHANEDPNTRQTNGTALNDGVSLGKDGSMTESVRQSSDPEGAPDLRISYSISDPVSASSVALFGCDTSVIAGQYSDTNFTGVQSGANGTTLDTLDFAAIGFVTAGGGQAGVDAANAAIVNSPFPVDTGDDVEQEEK
jgi:RHS repeat-associated protein